MDYERDVDPAKATFYVSEEAQNNVLKRRGIACSVFFEGKPFLLTSSSAVEAADNQKKLIAERFSSSHFGDHRLDVSFCRQLGNFAFLKIDKEYNGGTIGRSWVIFLNLESPSFEMKDLAKPFYGKRQFELQFKHVGSGTTIEVISEKGVERTSIIGAPIIIERKQMNKKHSGRFSVIGVVGLTSEEELCPCYWNHESPVAPEDQQTWIQYGETHVKLLIEGENLTKEKEKIIEEMLTPVVENYVKFHVYSRDNRSQAMKAFTDHLDKMYGMFLVTLGIGSLIIILDCRTLEGLELLWSDYRSGHLDEVAERYLVTDEIKEKLNLETICLKTTIEEKNYSKCREALTKLPKISPETYTAAEQAMPAMMFAQGASAVLETEEQRSWREHRETYTAAEQAMPAMMFAQGPSAFLETEDQYSWRELGEAYTAPEPAMPAMVLAKGASGVPKTEEQRSWREHEVANIFLRSSRKMKEFSEVESFDYIREHFKNIGTEQSSKGERLIEEIKRNRLLQDLRSYRPNLFLLCVVYEDHEGELPSSSSDLYQTLVRCVLRRYCAKQKLKANEEDMDLAKQFERDILALGELAWKCLLNGRHSFREDELKLERSDEKSIALGLGFVHKEESFKRSEPHHVFTFVHETFQEYLAASYIAHNLRGSEFHVLDQVPFWLLTWKYRKVFLFVCGILREEASILFTQIGETLQKDWDWSKCSDRAARFFTESWKESGNAERMANTLCSFLPFPQLLHVSEHHHEELINVLEACAGFSKVQTPAEVHFAVPAGLQVVKNIQRVLAGVPNVKTLIFPAIGYSIDCAEVGEVLRASKTLEKVTFSLSGEHDDGWASALDVGLGPDSSLSSVGLRIYGVLNQSALQAVENLMFNKCLSSLSITKYGDVQESLAKRLARGLAGESAVKFFDLCVYGKLSFDGAYSLEEGILRSGSLRNIKVSVNGELPVNWHAVGGNLHAKLAEKGVVSAIYPNTFSKVKGSQVTSLNRMLSETYLGLQNVTLNVWGELSGDGSEAVCELLLHTPVPHLTLNIHGKLTDEILRCAARCVKEQEKTSSITINAWVQMTEKENNLINELGLDKNPSVSLNVCGTSAPLEESSDSEVISIDEPSSLFEFFVKAEKGLSKSLSLTINHTSKARSFIVHKPWEVLERSTSLKSLTLTINIHSDVGNYWVHELGESLGRSTSLKSLTLTINIYNDVDTHWGYEVGEGLRRSTSLNSLTLAVNMDNNADSLSEYERLFDSLASGPGKLSTEYNFRFNICGKC